jgi:hypothetical protein
MRMLINDYDTSNMEFFIDLKQYEFAYQETRKSTMIDPNTGLPLYHKNWSLSAST